MSQRDQHGFERIGRKTLSTEARHRVTIQQKTLAGTGAAGFVETWADSTDVWAGISPIQAWQKAQYASIGVDTTHLIRISGLVEIAEHDRIAWGSRVFEVLTVEDIQERGIVKVVTCKERR